MRTALLHPRFASLSCDDCEKWMHTDGVMSRRGGELVPRNGQVTPCWKCPKLPPGVPKSRMHAIEMSDRNRAAWRHYQECRAVGSFPDDPIVRRNAAVIRAVVDSVAESKQDTLITLLGVLGSGR